MHGVDAGSVEDPPRKRYKQQDLGPWLLSATKDELDDAVADFFYGTGTPLHISRYLLSSASASTDRSSAISILLSQCHDHRISKYYLLCRHPLFTDMLKKVSLARGGIYTGPTYKALREGLVARANGRIT